MLFRLPVCSAETRWPCVATCANLVARCRDYRSAADVATDTNLEIGICPQSLLSESRLTARIAAAVRSRVRSSPEMWLGRPRSVARPDWACRAGFRCPAQGPALQVGQGPVPRHSYTHVAVTRRAGDVHLRGLRTVHPDQVPPWPALQLPRMWPGGTAAAPSALPFGDVRAPCAQSIVRTIS
jgi:hypothetical protein